MADAFVASEKVGEGGPWAGLVCLFTFEETERVRSERGLGMAFGMDWGCARFVCCVALAVGGLSASGSLHAEVSSVRSG